MIGTQAAAQLIVDRWDSTGLTTPFTPTEGVNLWWDRLVDSPDETLTVVGITSRPPEATFGADPAYRRPRVQVYARARTRDRASELAEAAWKALHASDAATSEGTVLRSVPTTDPHLANPDRDPQERALVVFTCELWLKET